MIASSDMNHYENDEITRVKDERAIARILALDPRGLYDVVRNESISMCGCTATVAMLIAVREARRSVRRSSCATQLPETLAETSPATATGSGLRE